MSIGALDFVSTCALAPDAMAIIATAAAAKMAGEGKVRIMRSIFLSTVAADGPVDLSADSAARERHL
jgi:hypothetical protein